MPLGGIHIWFLSNIEKEQKTEKQDFVTKIKIRHQKVLSQNFHRLKFSLLSRTGLDKARWKIFKSRAKEVENPVI